MRALIQRVGSACVEVEGRLLSEIGCGLLVLLGIGVDDDDDDAKYLAGKTCKLRVFDDDDGVMNLSVANVEGEILVVSQFTLMADCRRGNRPNYMNAADPQIGEKLYDRYVKELEALGCRVKTGAFGADMRVGLQNIGPVTIMLDSNRAR